ncbi:MAG: disulfide isomerase DsbC N-terminal domain-containing protein, partial [Enterobacteriaceae bacterium]
MKKTALLFTLMMMIVAPWRQAAANDLEQSLKKLGISGAEIKPSPAAGLKMVFTERGIIYITDDGKY